MRIALGCLLRLPILATALWGSLHATAQTRSVAITVDDLPCATCQPLPPSVSMKRINRRLIAGLVRAHAPATGFVIAGAVAKAGPAGQEVLQAWLRAGLELGSHTLTHPDFADVSLAEMEADTSAADRLLRPLLAARGRTLRFFRYPYNDTGDTQAKHDGFAAYLGDHGYQVATCTIDASDYVFAAAYARARNAEDTALAERIRAEYLAYSATEIDFYAALNRRVLGYEPPQVLLIHDSLLNADSIHALLALFRARSYRFVSLREAQSDPAYRIPDTLVTRYGMMWGYRWAKERGLGPLGMREAEPPDWITSYADGKPAAPASVPQH
jgi:peptidoglycan-N-acetylglucosamine deacetylase